MMNFFSRGALFTAIAIAVFTVLSAPGWADPTLTALATFNHADGADPVAGLLIDGAGNLYGTTVGAGPGGDGTVFKLDAANNYALSTLAAFNGANGGFPTAGLIADAAGNLYGTTFGGGDIREGTVFKLTAANNYTLTTLHDFDNLDGGTPRGGLIADATGNLYGTTEAGGGISNSGTVYKLDAANNFMLTTLTTFTGSNGLFPTTGLIADKAGNFYGTTSNFGSGSTVPATVFMLNATNKYALTTLTSFSLVATPTGTLTADAAGNLYGTTIFNEPNVISGTVFKLDVSNNYTLTTLYSFNLEADGTPSGGLIADAAGNLYGTTYGGTNNSNRYGMVFKLDASNNYALTTLYEFTGGNDGQNPMAVLIADTAGNLYGTTEGGDTGAGYFGTVFELSGTGFVVVPEPAGITLLALGTLLLLSWRSI